MTIKQFIEKAIEGGYPENQTISWGALYKLLLDPKAWQAVGKVEGWGGKCHDCSEELDGEICVAGGTHIYPKWRTQMINMVVALAEGKTLEEFIKTL